MSRGRRNKLVLGCIPLIYIIINISLFSVEGEDEQSVQPIEKRIFQEIVIADDENTSPLVNSK